MPGYEKITIISETKRHKRTMTFNRVYDSRINMQLPDPRPSDFIRASSAFMLPQPGYEQVQMEFTAAQDDDGHFHTMQVEDLDPVPEDIERIVTKATEHNLNTHQRAKLIAQLKTLVREDREHNKKENNK